ncbi:MAG: hypothetical protein LBR19_05175, partial [Bifidobacteriaceae bacterium]|nr:hypothetical protein [Bifidobacteriaceae bacterium]
MAQLQGDIGGLADELERQIAEQAQASAATGLEGASFVFPAGPTIPSPSPQAPPVPNPEPEPEPTDEKPTLEEIYNEYQVTDTDEMVSYPPWPVSEFVDPKSVTKEEARLLNEMAFGSLFLGKPEKLLAFYDIYDDALNRANATVPAPTSTDNHTDA